MLAFSRLEIDHLPLERLLQPRPRLGLLDHIEQPPHVLHARGLQLAGVGAGGVLVRLEHRVTGAKVEGGPLQVRNESYHVSINHTHVGAAYGYV